MYHTANLWLVITFFCDHVVTMSDHPSGDSLIMVSPIIHSCQVWEPELNCPLYRAVLSGDVDKVEKTKWKCDINSISAWGTPLQIACQHNNIDMVKVLIQKGADLKPGDGKPLLFLAVERDSDHVVLSLITEFGCDPNIKDKDGETPLHLACRLNSNSQVEISHGADLSDIEGYSPLHVTCEIGGLKLVQTLIDHGASLNALDKDGNTPLDIAVRSERFEILKMFLQCKGCFPLHVACETGKLGTVRVLMKYGVDPSALDESNHTPLMIAVQNERHEIVKALLHDYGCDPNIKGNLLLHEACGMGNLSLVETLITHGADLNALDESNHTPLMVAVQNKNYQIRS